MEIYFFPNGNTAVIKDKKQVPELQESWFILYCKFLESKGIDPATCKYNLNINGIVNEAEVFKTSEGQFNWRFK